MAEDGQERLRRWQTEGRGVPAAFSRLGARFDDVRAGSTTVRLPLTRELLLAGRPTGAVTAMLADFGLTTSVVASLPDLRGVTTVSMTVDHLALPPTSGALVARCQAAPYVDGGPQHCRGELRSEDGRVVASVSGWFLPTEAPPGDAQRIVESNEPAADSLDGLLGVAPGADFSLHARDALSNALGTLHGGIGALAASLAAQAVLVDGMRPLTSAFTYLRPTPRDGTVQVTGTLERQGRRTGTASAQVRAPDGKVVLRAAVVAAA